jgi:hypothetical protein
MTIVGCKSTKFSGNSKEKEGKIYIFVQITLCNKTTHYRIPVFGF